MHYKKSLRTVAVGGFVLAPLRVFLKTVVMDTQTGFYNAGYEWLVLLYHAALALTAAGVIFTAFGKPDDDLAPLRGNRLLEGAACLYGLTLAAVSLPSLLSALQMRSVAVMNAFPRGLLILEHGMGLAAGAAMLVLSLCIISGARTPAIFGALSLLPVLWQALDALQRFLSFRQVNTDSDQLLETLYMTAAVLFLLAQARSLANVSPRRRGTVIYALLTVLFGVVLIVGQLSALSVLGPGVSGPTPPRMLMLGATCLYALCLALSAALPPRKASAAEPTA